MRPGSKLRHGADVALLRGCQSIEADAEEARVEGRDGRVRRTLDVGRGDWRRRRRVPGMLAKFLKEIRIAERLPNDQAERVIGKLHVLLPCRLGDRDARGRLGERTNLREVEQPLRIRLGSAGLAT